MRNKNRANCWNKQNQLHAKFCFCAEQIRASSDKILHQLEKLLFIMMRLHLFFSICIRMKSSGELSWCMWNFSNAVCSLNGQATNWGGKDSYKIIMNRALCPAIWKSSTLDEHFWSTQKERNEWKLFAKVFSVSFFPWFIRTKGHFAFERNWKGCYEAIYSHKMAIFLQ